jgi:hypothetical protein
MGINGVTEGVMGAGPPLLLPHNITTKTKNTTANATAQPQTGKTLRGTGTATGAFIVGGSTLTTPLTAPSKAATNSRQLLYLLIGSFAKAFPTASSTEDGMEGFIDLIGGGAS